MTRDIEPELLCLRSDLMWWRFKWRLARSLLSNKEFDPTQPRVPAGNPDGGRWTGSGSIAGSSSETSPRARAIPGRLTAASTQRLTDCEFQFHLDTLRCRKAKMESCWSPAMVRKVACDRGHPIPPLYY